MIQPLISVVIPAFNVEAYVQNSLDSVLQQSRSFSEIIVINDGSTDRTLDIIRRYDNAPFVRILSTRNRGLGPARNLGARLATSRFLFFLDADDCIHPDLVCSFYDALTADPLMDLFAFSFSTFEDSTKVINTRFGHQYDRNLVGDGASIFADLIFSNNFHSASWGFVFRKSLINWKRSGFFNILHEDEELTPRLFVKSKRMHLSPSIYYFYRIRPGSIMSTSVNSRFLRSRIGYFVSLLSCFTLFPNSVCNLKLCRALFKRIRYLCFHAFVPFAYPLIRIKAKITK